MVSGNVYTLIGRIGLIIFFICDAIHRRCNIGADNCRCAFYLKLNFRALNIEKTMSATPSEKQSSVTSRPFPMSDAHLEQFMDFLRRNENRTIDADPELGADLVENSRQIIAGGGGVMHMSQVIGSNIDLARDSDCWASANTIILMFVEFMNQQ